MPAWDRSKTSSWAGVRTSRASARSSRAASRSSGAWASCSTPADSAAPGMALGESQKRHATRRGECPPRPDLKTPPPAEVARRLGRPLALLGCCFFSPAGGAIGPVVAGMLGASAVRGLTVAHGENPLAVRVLRGKAARSRQFLHFVQSFRPPRTRCPGLLEGHQPRSYLRRARSFRREAAECSRRSRAGRPRPSCATRRSRHAPSQRKVKRAGSPPRRSRSPTRRRRRCEPSRRGSCRPTAPGSRRRRRRGAARCRSPRPPR